MLYSFIAIGLAVSIPFFCLFSFKAGIRFRDEPEKEAAKPVLPKPKRKPTDKEQQAAIISRNIDNYTDPWCKQEDIK